MFVRSISKKPWPTLINHFRTVLTVSFEDQYITVVNSKKSMKFPQIWLRDNCQCPECFHKNSHSRTREFNLDIKANKVTALDNSVKIEWSDQHTSVYEIKWLKEREFCSENQRKYLDEFYRMKMSLWGKDTYEKYLQKFQYDNVMETDESLKKWIEALAICGVAMIENVPPEDGSIRKLANRVGFIKRTHYGEEFIVKAKSGTKNYAYLSKALPLHTDLPYYEYKPGLNLLHCMIQSKSSGGQSLLADGFYAAERLRKEDPGSFKILTETVVDWNDIGSEEDGECFHSIYRTPVINVDSDGQYMRINRSIPQRDSHFTVNLKDVIPWYRAYSKLVKIFKEETYSFKMHEGQLLTFNNLRILHGRTGYDDTGRNVRYIVGAYLDWDIVFAKLRSLKGDYNHGK